MFKIVLIVLEIEEFRRITSDFLSLVEKLATKVEQEKMRAIGAHNVLQTMEKQKETDQQELRVFLVMKLLYFWLI